MIHTTQTMSDAETRNEIRQLKDRISKLERLVAKQQSINEEIKKRFEIVKNAIQDTQDFLNI